MHINDNCLALLAMMCCKCGSWQDGFKCFGEWCCKNCCWPGGFDPGFPCCPHDFFKFKGCHCGHCFDGFKKSPCPCGFDKFKGPFCFGGFDGFKGTHGGHKGGVCKGCGCDLSGFNTCKRCGGCLCKLKWW